MIMTVVIFKIIRIFFTTIMIKIVMISMIFKTLQ